MSSIPTGGNFVSVLIVNPLDVNFVQNARIVRFVLFRKNSNDVHRWLKEIILNFMVVDDCKGTLLTDSNIQCRSFIT